MAEEKGSSLPFMGNSHFFKVILPQSPQNGSLELPPCFVKRHGNCLPKYACLEVPTGAMWKVELKRFEEEVWLHNGWRNFVEFYSIKPGYFLLFRYEGGSFFHVLIFDHTALEIKYPPSAASTSCRVKLDQSKISKIQVNDSGDDACPRKLHKSREVPLVNQSRKREAGCSSIPRTQGKRPAASRSSANRKISYTANIKIQLDAAACNYKTRFLKKAKVFKSNKPHFLIYMSPSYVSCRRWAHIPISHFKRYLKDYNHGEKIIVLHGSNGKTWTVQYEGVNSNPKRAKFTSGWKDFMLDNCLQVGDVCAFELMDDKVKEYKVTTFCVADYA